MVSQEVSDIAKACQSSFRSETDFLGSERANPTIPENWKQLYRRFPLLLRLVRFLVYLRMDIGWYIFRYKAGAWARAIAEKRFKEDMKTRAPEGLAEALTPKYPLGTKRIVNDMYVRRLLEYCLSSQC